MAQQLGSCSTTKQMTWRLAKQNYHRTSLSHAHAEFPRSRLVIRIAEAMPDAGPLDRMTGKRDSRIRRSPDSHDHTRPGGQIAYQFFRVRFQPVYPSHVLVQERKENDGANAEAREM